MAIQVNGTTVIDNSRQLTNIASVDSATVTALGNAGVGGVSSGTTANRPSSPSEGDLYYNTDLDTLEVYRYVISGLAWAAVPSFGQPTTGTTYKLANIQSKSSVVCYNSNYASVGTSITNGGGDGYARTGFALGAGNITIQGSIRTRNSSYTASVRLMKNGSQISEQTTTSTSAVTKTFTTSISPGDSLDVQFKTTQYGQDYDIYQWFVYSNSNSFGSVILT